MKRVPLAALCLFASSLFTAFGSPTCSWTSFTDVDCTTNSAGYVIYLNGNTVSEDGSSVTIGDSPIKITYQNPSTTISSAISVLVECTIPDNQAGVIASFGLANNYPISSYWDGVSTLDQRQTNTVSIIYGSCTNLLTKPQNVLLTYQASAGTRTLVDGYTAISLNGSLKWGDYGAKSVYIGNDGDVGTYQLTNLVVSAIHLYVGTAQTSWPTSDVDVGPSTDFESFAINFGAGQAEVDTTLDNVLGFDNGAGGSAVKLSTWNNVSGSSGTAFLTSSDNTHHHKLTLSSSGATNSGTTLATDATEVQKLTYGALAASTDSAATITLADMPTEGYRVAVIMSGTGPFNAVTVNGTEYTYDTTESDTVAGSTTWGSSTNDGSALTEGSNVLYVTGLTASSLTISATSPVAGIIVYSKVVDHAEVTADSSYSELVWSFNSAPTAEDDAQITVTDGMTLTIDSAVTANELKFVCEGSFTLVIGDGGSLDGVASLSYAGVTGNVIWGSVVDTVISNTNFTYAAGAGTETTPASVNYNGGTLPLAGGTFYYPYGAWTFTDTTVEMTGDAKIDLSASTNETFGVGTATYYLGGTSSISAKRFVLAEGGAGRTAVFTMTNASSVVIAGDGVPSSNSRSADIIFGPYGTSTTTFTIADEATFTATASDILIGYVNTSSHAINIEGGTMTVQGIKTSSAATGSNSLTLSGGELQLGTTGIDTYGGGATLPIAVTNSAVISGTAATVPITQTIAVDEGAILTLANVAYETAAAADAEASTTTADSVDAITIALSGDVSGDGTVTINPKVNLTVSADAGMTFAPASTVIGTDATLTLTNSGTTTATATLDTTFSSGATVVVGANVNLAIPSTMRPATDVTFDLTDTTSTLTVYLSDALETVTLTLSGITTSDADRVIVIDQNGNTVTTSLTEGEGTNVIIIATPVPTFSPTASNSSLATDSLWSSNTAADDTDNFIISLSEDVTLALDSSVSKYGNVYVQLADTVEAGTTHTLTLTESVPTTYLILSDNVNVVLTNETGALAYSTPIGGTGTLTIPAGVTVTPAAPFTHTGGTVLDGVVQLTSANVSAITAETALGGVDSQIAGAGQVIITAGGYIPYKIIEDENQQTGWVLWSDRQNPLGAVFTNESWTGTVTMRGYTQGAVSLNGTTTAIYEMVSYMGNKNSVVEFDGVSCYFGPDSSETSDSNATSMSTMTAGEIRILNTTSSGTQYGLHVNNGKSGICTKFIGKVTGEGPISMYGARPRCALWIVGDCSEWTGDATVKSNFRLILSDETTADLVPAAMYSGSANNTWDNILAVYTSPINMREWSVVTDSYSTGDPKKVLQINVPCTINMTSNTLVTATSGIMFTNDVEAVITDSRETRPATLASDLTLDGTLTINHGSLQAASVTMDESDSVILNTPKSEFIVGDYSNVLKTYDGYISSTPQWVYESQGRNIDWYQIVRKVIGDYRYHYLLDPGTRLNLK